MPLQEIDWLMNAQDGSSVADILQQKLGIEVMGVEARTRDSDPLRQNLPKKMDGSRVKNDEFCRSIGAQWLSALEALQLTKLSRNIMEFLQCPIYIGQNEDLSESARET